MSQVNNNTTGNVLSNLNINNQPKETKSNELGQTAFLELMITQLNNQDPLSPQDNTEFVAQLAQFSSLEQLTQIQKSLDAIGVALGVPPSTSSSERTT